VDPGIIVGYLVAKLMGRAQTFADQQVEKLLDRLFNRVRQRVGDDRALDRLARDPRNEVAQEWARSSIEQAAGSDPTFAAELARLQQQLDQRAPDLLVYAPGAGTVVGINSGYLIQGPVTIHQGGDASDWSDASASVKVLAVLAIVLCLSGIGLFGYVVFSDQPGPGETGFGEMPEGLALAGGIFFAGFVLAAIASMAHGLRRRPPPGPFSRR
jgi:hypothetical protein